MTEITHYHDIRLEYDDVEDLLSDCHLGDLKVTDDRYVTIVVSRGTLAEAIANSDRFDA